MELRAGGPRVHSYAITSGDEEYGLIFYVASALFVANFALGVLVQFGIVDTRPFRWLHHALFFAVFASAALAVAVGFSQGALASCAMIFYATGFVSLL
jgi:vacuolar-type H+-ATPase subunit I/STV1